MLVATSSDRQTRVERDYARRGCDPTANVDSFGWIGEKDREERGNARCKFGGVGWRDKALRGRQRGPQHKGRDGAG